MAMENLTWNDKILECIKKTLTVDQSLSSMLIDTLLIGRESVYRRIRGDVPFTFEEVIKIAQTIGLSIDSMVGLADGKRAVFELNMLSSGATLDDYSSNLNQYVRLFQDMGKSPNSIARYALNTLPYSFYLSYKNLARFRYFRWIYQASKSQQEQIRYANVTTPPKLEETQKAFVASNKYINRTLMILDRNIFAAMIVDIEYFYHLQMLTVEDITLLQDELFDMLDMWEKIAIAGQFNTGKEVEIYLANVDIEASYSLFEYEKGGYAYLRLYGVSGVESQSQQMRDIQRDWIESLRRYSTLISQSGEVIRHQFFKEQREMVQKMSR